MLLPSFFIVEAEEFARLSLTELPENVSLIFRIAANKLSDKSFYSNLFRSEIKFPFCLLVYKNAESKEYAKDLDALVAFTFHYKYIKTSDGNPLIIFQTKEADSDAGYISSVQEALYNQGYEKSELVIINNEQPISGVQNENKLVLLPLSVDKNTIITEYVEALKTTNALSSYFFKISSPEKLEAILSALQKTEEAFLKQFPQQYHLLKELNKQAVQQQKLQIKFGLLQEKNDSQERYNSFYRQAEDRYKKQVLEVVNFYTNEYEVLPLWFKRLGHVVKVMTGKRTFKSLYNDNVKKYNTNEGEA